tara:strand:+ start:900 stop:1523 length:624 start_codon:yes stop_codon:yes gene_type:complete
MLVLASDFNEFVETYHKNNGTKNPLDERVIEIDKRKDDTIYYDKDTKKFSYTKHLCLGLLPSDIEEDIAKMIHQHQFKTKIFISRDPKYVRPGCSRFRFPIDRYLWGIREGCKYTCPCYTKKGTICGKSSHWSYQLEMNTIPMKYVSDGRVELCKTHKKMIDRQFHGCEGDESYLYYLLGWNYSISHGIPIKLLRNGVRGRVINFPR